MKVSKISAGQLVSSKAGRDKDKFYLIYDIPDENFVRIIDGDTRKIDNPKRKNIKHLIFYDKTYPEIAVKLNSGVGVSNADIRKVIQEIRDFSKS